MEVFTSRCPQAHLPKSQGDCPSFEPLITAYVDAALSPTAETVVALRVLRLSA
jgi:hypothetical protein